MSNLTMILISLGVLGLVIGFDVFLALTKRRTITQWVRAMNPWNHWIAFLFGYLTAHFFGKY